MTGKVSKTPSRFSLTSIKSGAMPIRISMNGEDLGEVEEQAVARMLSEGVLDRTAHYWMEGMPEWRPITEILVEADSLPPPPESVIARPSPRSKQSLTKAQITFLTKRSIPYEGLGRPEVEVLIAQTKAAEEHEKERRNAEAEARMAEERRLSLLPTPKQLAYLDYHRVKYDASLTKQDARELIDATIKKCPDSKWNRVKHIVRPDLYEFEESEAHYQKQIDEAQRQMSILKSAGGAPEDIEDAKATLYDAKVALEDHRESFGFAVDEWLEKFEDYEFTELEAFMEVFKKPSKMQIRAVLERFEKHYRLPLDTITDDEFFLVYHKLYPDCFKKGRSASFNVDDITIDPYYEKSEKKRRSNSASAGSSPASLGQAGGKKRGCVSQIVRGILIAIGILFALAFMSALLR